MEWTNNEVNRAGVVTWDSREVGLRARSKLYYEVASPVSLQHHCHSREGPGWEAGRILAGRRKKTQIIIRPGDMAQALHLQRMAAVTSKHCGSVRGALSSKRRSDASRLRGVM